MEITIMCRTPGMRRNGSAHPATRTYPEGHWTDAQMEAFEQDPAFEVVVSEGADTGPTDPEERLNLIRSVLPGLTDADKTKAGRPKIPALEKILGFKPTADEIEAALPAPE